jgi:hypothetical protein
VAPAEPTINAHEIPIVSVTGFADRDLEVVLLDAAIREDLAHIDRDPGGSGDRPGDAVRLALIDRDNANALGPVQEDGILGDQLVVLNHRLRHDLENLSNVVLPPIRQVGGDTTRTDVVVVHPQAGRLLKKGQQQFAFPPAVEHQRQRPDVHTLGRQPNEVAGYPIEFGHQDANGLAARRDLDAE